MGTRRERFRGVTKTRGIFIPSSSKPFKEDPESAKREERGFNQFASLYTRSIFVIVARTFIRTRAVRINRKAMLKTVGKRRFFYFSLQSTERGIYGNMHILLIAKIVIVIGKIIIYMYSG